MNEKDLLQLMLRQGTASRAELAVRTGMTQVTVGRIVDGLLERGILEEHPEPREEGARRGRPGRPLGLDRRQVRLLGVQLGVRHTRLRALPLGLRDEDERWDAELETPATAGGWVEAVADEVRQLTSDGTWGAVVSVPGILDERAGRVLLSPNLHWTESASLREVLSDRLGMPVAMVQEIRALALGHVCRSEARDFLLVDFGDGVGAAAVVGGRLYDGPLPISGELGHAPVLGNTRPCGCGASGCVETLVSRGGMLETFRSATGRAEAGWEEMADRVASAGVEPWLGDALDATAQAIAGAVNVLGLSHVVVTGSLAELPECVAGRLFESVRRGSMWARLAELELEAAPRRRLAGLLAVGVERFVVRT